MHEQLQPREHTRPQWQFAGLQDALLCGGETGVEIVERLSKRRVKHAEGFRGENGGIRCLALMRPDERAFICRDQCYIQIVILLSVI
jgi:hypothetical protein